MFPYIADRPIFVFTDYKDLLIYCGYAIFSNSKEDLIILKKILNTPIFWYYIKNTAKPYSGGYYSLAKNFVKNFPICDLNKDEKSLLLNLKNEEVILKILYKKYSVKFTL